MYSNGVHISICLTCLNNAPIDNAAYFFQFHRDIFLDNRQICKYIRVMKFILLTSVV
jgi:hypothetical protein